jgi:diguanylate cyclase
MPKNILKIQAIGFAFCIAAVAFLLTTFSGIAATHAKFSMFHPVIIALSCGVLSWGAADRLIGLVTASINSAVGRITAAAEGDLDTPASDELTNALPGLSQSIDNLFAQVRSDIESANSLALFDPVTALPNRLHFRNETEAVLNRMSSGDRAALFFIDLDHFKAVNDTYGHAAGDQLLIMIANRLRALSSRPDGSKSSVDPVVGRLAGDEFTVFMPFINDRRVAGSLAAKMVTALSEPFTISGQTVKVGASIGIAMWPQHGNALTDLMRAADVAMYRSKEEGRNQFQFFSSSMAAQLAQRIELDHELRVAIDDSQFAFHFQPQISLADSSVITHEVLLRWYHPSGDVRVPNTFMPAAERAGLMNEIGRKCFTELARLCAQLNAGGLHQRLSINLSPRDFDDGKFFDRLQDEMTAAGASLSMVELEISERLAMESAEVVGRQLELCRKQGAKITIDNFGRGFTNITRLRALPIDRIKLDATLTKDIVSDPEARAIVQSFVAMMHGMGKEVVAEAIENTEQMQVLKVMGCNAVQGYAVAKPMNEKALSRWLDERAKKKMAA